MLLVFASATYFNDSIKGIDSYSIFTEKPNIEYELKSDDNDNSLGKLSYQPVISSFLGLSATANDISLSFVYQNEDDENESIQESTLFDIQLEGVYKKSLWSLFYQNYQGLYITDSEIASDLPQANSWNYGFGIKYFTNDSYNPKHSLKNFSLKKETNWSWIQGMSINRFKLFSSNTLIPPQFTNFNQLNGLSAFQSTSLIYDLGITGMFGYKQFFIDSLMTLGLQIQNQEFEGLDQESRVITDSAVGFSLNTGYQVTDNSSLGIKTSFQSIGVPIKNARYTSTRSVVRVYYKHFF